MTDFPDEDRYGIRVIDSGADWEFVPDFAPPGGWRDGQLDTTVPTTTLQDLYKSLGLIWLPNLGLPPMKSRHRGADSGVQKKVEKARAEAQTPLPPLPPPTPAPESAQPPVEAGAADPETAATFGGPGQVDIPIEVWKQAGFRIDGDDPKPEDWDWPQLFPLDDVAPRVRNGPQGAPDLDEFLRRLQRNRPQKGHKDPTQLDPRPLWRATAADPVELATGVFTLSATDLSVPSPHLPIALRRAYRSGRPYDGPFGFAWDHNFNVYLRRLNDGSMALWAGGLRELYFKPAAGGAWEGGAGVFAEIRPSTQTPNEYDVLWRGGLRWRMAQPLGWTDAERVPLHRIVDRYGRTLTLEYDDKDRLTAVNDVDARGLRFEYGGCGLLERVSDHTGTRAVGYRHHANAELLEAVILPPTANFPNGIATRYEYDLASGVPAMRYNIRRVFDTHDRLFLENRYAEPDESWAFNAVTWQRSGDDEWRFEYEPVQFIPPDPQYLDLAASRTLVRAPDGALRAYAFNWRGDLIDERVRLVRDGSHRVVATGFRYDAAGNLIERTRPDGSRTAYHYDSANADCRARANLLRREEISALPAINPSRTVATVQYDGQFQLPLSLKDESHAETKLVYQFQGSGPAAQAHLTEQHLPPVPGESEPAIQRYVYNPEAQLAEIVSPAGVRTRYEYFSAGPHKGFLRTMTVGEGAAQRQQHCDYDAAGFLQSSDDGPGRRTDFQMNALGQVEVIIAVEIEGRRPVIRQWFNEAGALARRERPLGEGWLLPDPYVADIFDSDLLGRHVAIHHAANSADARTWSYRLDHTGRVTRAWTPGGRTERLDWDERGLMLRRVLAEGTADEVTFAKRYDHCGRLKGEVAPDGSSIEYHYDPWGRLWHVNRPDGSRVTLTWGPCDRLVGYSVADVPDAQGTPTRLLEQATVSYDARGRTVSRSDAVSSGGSATTLLTTIYAFDADDRLVKTTSAHGVITTLAYDAAGRLIRCTDGHGNARTWTYDTFGQVGSATQQMVGQPSGTAIAFQYDPWGRTIASVGPESTLGWHWDDAGGLIEELQGGALVRTFRYNVHGQRVTSVADPGNAAWTHRFDYDFDGALIRYTDPTAAATAFAHDRVGRLTEVVLPDQSQWVFAHDPAARTLTRHAPSGAVVTTVLDYTYAAPQRVSATPAVGQLPAPTDTFEYDGLGRVTRAESGSQVVTRAYDTVGRLRSETAQGKTLTVEYDDLARTRILAWPSSHVERTLHDVHNQPTAIQHGGPADWSDSFTFQYDAAGRVLSATYANGVVRHSAYDELGRLASALDLLTTAVVAGVRVAYDARGHRALVQRAGDLAGNEMHRFDAGGRLIGYAAGFTFPDLPANPSAQARAALAAAAHAPAATGSLRDTFVLDAADVRRQRERQVAGQSQITTYQVSTTHRTTAVNGVPISYNADGARVADSEYRYTYDAMGRLREIRKADTNALVYTLGYDPLQRNAAGSVQGTPYERWFLFHQVIEERIGSGAGSQVLQHTLSPGGVVPLRVAALGGDSHYLTPDDHLSTAAIYSANGGVGRVHCLFDPFGAVSTKDATGATVTAPAGLTWWRGMRRLEGSALYVAHYRVYDANLGVFLSPDPFLYLDSASSYAYCGHNPADFADPSGLAKEAVGASGPSKPGAEPPSADQTAAETIITAEPPFEPEVSDPKALAAAEGMGHIEVGDVWQLVKGLYNGGVNALPTLAGPIFGRAIRAAEIPKAELDPRYGGAGIIGEHLGENLALEAVALIPAALNGVRRILSNPTVLRVLKSPVFLTMGVGGGSFGGTRVVVRTPDVPIIDAPVMPKPAQRATMPVADLGPVGSAPSRRSFRNRVVRVISDDPAHPLKELLDPNTGRLRPSTRKGFDQVVWADNPQLVEAGHYESAKGLAGAKDRFMLMSAHENRLVASIVEHRRVGGMMLESGHVVSIGGVPVDLTSAEALFEAGLLDAEVLANAPLVIY